MAIYFYKSKARIYSATRSYSEGCPSGYSGPVVTRTVTLTSYESEEKAADLALAEAKRQVKEQLLTGCILQSGGAEPTWVFDMRTKECVIQTHPRNIARSHAKKYDDNPLSATYHNNRPVEETPYLNNGEYFTVTENDTSCPIDLQNDLKGRVFIRQGCPAGQEGQATSVIVPFGSFYVSSLEADAKTKADAKAVKYLDDHGQNIANGMYAPGEQPPFENGSSNINFPAPCKVIPSKGAVTLTAIHLGNGKAAVEAIRQNADPTPLTVTVLLFGEDTGQQIYNDILILSGATRKVIEVPIASGTLYTASITLLSDPLYTAASPIQVSGTPY